MESIYEKNAKIFKALGDSNRVKILDILSCDERCACDILENFEFTQPTLSHHMKVLIDCELVVARKEGIWNHYSINKSRINEIKKFAENLLETNKECICNTSKCNK